MRKAAYKVLLLNADVTHCSVYNAELWTSPLSLQHVHVWQDAKVVRVITGREGGQAL